MTDLLEEAVAAVRALPDQAQDEIARLLLQLAGGEQSPVTVLSPDERDALSRSKAAAAEGDFATDEQVSAVWAKYGL